MGGAASGPAGWGRGRRPWGQSGAQSLGHRPTHVQAGGRPALPTSPSQRCPEYEDMVAAGLGLRLRARSPLWQRPGALNFHRGDNQRGAKHCTPRLHQDTASTSRLLSGVHADGQRAMVTKPLYSPAPGWERADGGSSALGVLEAPASRSRAAWLAGHTGCPFCSAGDGRSLPALGAPSRGSRVTCAGPGFGGPCVAVPD